MIPCRSICSNYTEGCHKTCTRWKEYQQHLKDENTAKKQYLRLYNEQGSALIRQCMSIAGMKTVVY